jgi:L-asparagine transporter-like permease
MKPFSSFNWKNFLQRTALFFAVFLVIRLLVDVVERDVSFTRILNQSLIRYLLFAMVLGLLDSETWFSKKDAEEKDKLTEFKSSGAAFFHYTGVAFFISVVCTIIITVFSFIRWLIILFGGNKKTEVFPEFGKLALVCAAIGICFAAFDAFRNWYKRRKKANA